jgi:SAM-dependent methyltransferase
MAGRDYPCRAVPTTTWNKRWGGELNRFLERSAGAHYGDQWGDPSASRLRYLVRKLRYRHRLPGDLAKVRSRYLEPYATPDAVALEIGAGGGRWTRYLLAAREVIVVELNREFVEYLERRFPDAREKLRFYETSGYELRGIADESVDFVFSFGTFVHIDPEGIDEYLGEIRRVLRPGRVASLHYGDRSKPFFAGKPPGHIGFSDMNAEKMERFAAGHGFEVVAHDRKTLNHSNVAVLRRPS